MHMLKKKQTLLRVTNVSGEGHRRCDCLSEFQVLVKHKLQTWGRFGWTETRRAGRSQATALP